ncbi:MAG: TetR/AcrR family transcriptional regulator [Spirochaetaceae bacterium]|nr:TetR/AcrR family transcriptional regulator [Spirochaetaceae bacterium]
MSVNETANGSTQSRIIEKALFLFKSRGFMDVTVKDICEECGITRGAFYYYYKTKDEILDDIYVASDYITTHEFRDIVQEDNYIEQFYKLHSVYLERTLEVGPEIMGQVLKRYIDKGTKLAAPQDVAVFDMYVFLIQKAQDAGQILCTAPASVLADAAVHLSNSLGLIWCSKRGAFDYKKEFRKVQDALFMLNIPQN